MAAELVTDEELIETLYARSIEDANGCYIWQGPTAANGYGRVSIGGSKTIAVHRRVLSLTLGRPIPRHMDACHRCDVRACIRAEHLFEGTRSDNVRDSVAKGRHMLQLHPELNPFATEAGKKKRARGERHGSAKLTEADVLQIRELYATGQHSQRKLAARYSISPRNILTIVKGQGWRHV